MSSNASTHVDGVNLSTTDYDELLEDLDIAIDEVRRKIEQGRVRDPEREKVRVKQFRTMGYLVNVKRQVAQDRDLEELAEKLEELEAAQKARVRA